MKKHFPLLTLLLGLSVTTVASPIQPQRAKQLAENFFGGIKARKAPLKITYQAQKWGSSDISSDTAVMQCIES